MIFTRSESKELSEPLVRSYSTIRVRYADTDQMRIVHHARFFEYFELGRSDLIRQLGMPYAQLEEQGIFLPVIEAVARYHKPARYDECIIVESSIYELPKATVKIHYRVFNEDKSIVLADGWTLHGFLNGKNGRPMRAPQVFLNLFPLVAPTS